MKSLNVRLSLASMISLLLLAAFLLGFSSVIPIAASPIEDGTTTDGGTPATMSDNNTSLNTTTTTGSATPRVDLADEPFAVGHYRTVFDNMTSETQVQFTFEGNTTITLPNSTETIRTRDTGQGSVIFLPGGGSSTVRGQIHMTTEDGSENATGDFMEFFKFESSTGIGVAYFSTNSTGMLAPLNNMIAVYLDEVLPNEDSILRFFEWKSEGAPIGNDNGTSSGGNDNTTTTEMPAVPIL